eukprot:TRINITY_DN42025_c0_g1_i1.p1 TRINITY_DN42025_c0_g1~~TRINITY_DN42025_c0_g1_i1.p1  ORF type:complete len:858 (-),score=155.62 TRINITY_DN42025_c0_g1_i1:79-2652(-)
MSRRKQGIPKKSDGGDEEVNGDKIEQGPDSVSDKDSEGCGEDTEVTMPILESLEPRGRSRSPSPPPSSPPRMSPEDTKVLKMKSPEELLANPMDILKSSPFLLPAHLLALNPQLYAAQFAQLQAAQMLLAKTQQDGPESEHGENSIARKRGGDDNSLLDFESKQKHARSSSPKPVKDFLPKPERPLDLSGSKSPDFNREAVGNYFNPLMPAGLLSFFNQFRPPTSSPGRTNYHQTSSPSPSPPGRHTSPWQAQWANKNADGANPEDVFKCVWCKESYHTLDQLTKHMRDAKHHTMPQYGMSSMGSMRSGPPVSSPMRPSMPLSSPHQSMPSPPRHNRDLLREQLPLPRKLVRGQDVWIGRSDENTRDILKCMGCGASFRSLDLLTKHMQETQHYKKVISHDQISSWKYPDAQSSSKNLVNSVLTCKVCEKGYSSLKELSDHMVRNNHYNGDSKMPRNPTPQQSQASKDRKKALPVKKLLELERARQEVAGNTTPISAKEIMESGKLLCERCEEKIPIDIFIPHIQQCVGRPRFLKTPSHEPASPPSGNKDSNTGSKSESKEGSSDGSSSILGSLEQLVKGNFVASSSTRIIPPISSPVNSFPPQSSPIGKFSINNLFPTRPSPAVSPSHSSNSKPSSPNSSRSNSILQPSLEKMLDSPFERAISSPTNGNDAKNCNDRQSPLSEKSRSSPRSDDEKHIPELPVVSTAQIADVKLPQKSDGNNALAALQMFCNDQKKTPKTSVKESPNSPMSDPGAILAFSWACNQANNGDSAIKCPFCDTPFISKGAYRHHLSKMHFTKENLGNISAPHIPQGSLTQSGVSNRTPSPQAKDAEESLQSKYQKYSQLAKQLSCYDGTN